MELMVRVIASTKFLGVPEDFQPREDQDQGSDGARLIEMAGRVCYDSYSKGRSSAAYHEHIKEVGHGSVAEHATISFYIEGISRGCLMELTRHRAGVAFSVRSTRFVDESESEWVWHPLIEQSYDWENASGDVRALEGQAKRLYAELVENVTGMLHDQGVDKTTARKQARGAARGVLGNALPTALIFTANIRALRNVLEQRASPAADAEIRLLAGAIFEAALEVAPEYLSDYRREECPDGIGFALVTEHRKL